MQITWLKHREAKKAHGFIQLGGGGVKPWIVSLCRKVRFKPGDFTHQMHDLFTKDMRKSVDDFCDGCISKFSEAEAQPKVQMKWPSVKCPECGGKAWMTDSVHIIVCDHCNMNYAVAEPLYDKEPKVKDHDQQAIRVERPRPALIRGTDDGGDREQIQDVGDGAGSIDGMEAGGANTPDDTVTKH